MAPTDRHDLSALLRRANCTHAYLDVGSNIGVQIRKLFEPRKYHSSPAVDIFKQNFGPPPHCNVCAVGIEPNPRHMARLREMVRQLTRAYAPVTIIHAAAATADGTTRFVLPEVPDVEHADWTARIPVRKKLPAGHIAITVETVDLADIIRQIRAAIPGRLLMKLDVEGRSVKF